MMETILNTYYENNAKKLHKLVDQLLSKFGGLSDKDYDDFYSIANEIFTYVIKKYDGRQSFDGFLYACLSNRFKSEMTARNRQKRMAERYSVSMDAPLGDNEEVTVGELIPSDFDIDIAVSENMHRGYDERIEKYLLNLSKVQRQIIERKLRGASITEIKEELGLSDKLYKQQCRELKSYANISILYCDQDIPETKEELMMSDNVTMEKSKEYNLSIVSIAKKMDKHTLRFDHPLQREADQWSPAMKSNLISDILQGNPIPSLVFAEQVVNGVAIIWNLDGKQKCTNAYMFMKDEYKISRNIRRFMIEYQAPMTDEAGNVVLDEAHFPVYENREFDIRGKKFSELPEELQEKFTDYSFKITQYINCSSEDIAYHIARYNDGKPMSASQKGVTRLGETFAEKVKAISGMSFFKDMGGYKISEYKNGTINRVVVESVMASNYLKDWKKKQEDMCEYIKDKAATSDFDRFEDMVERLEQVVNEDVSDMFDAKDSFLWFGLFARFLKTEMDDKRFIEFMSVFKHSLHRKKVKGMSFDDLNGKSTKDKNVVISKMNHLETLMREYLGTSFGSEKEKLSVLDFIKQNVNQGITERDIKDYEEDLEVLTLHVNGQSRLLDQDNKPSLLAIIAYGYKEDIRIDEWIDHYFKKNATYCTDQKENYLHMKADLKSFIRRKDKVCV